MYKRKSNLTFEEEFPKTPSRVVSMSKDKNIKVVPTTYRQGLAQVSLELQAMLAKKHHDYGVDNLKKFGEFGILVRCSDKVERLNNILKSGAAVAETKEDTWLDLAGYAIQALMMAKGYFELPE
jgi:hypothetical protein